MSQKGIVYVAVLKRHKCNKTANINVKKLSV